MKTVLCERLGIELPIIQAPMGGAVDPSLAAAVSNAGGLGMLAPWRADVETLRRQIRETRALTSRPFGVNLNLDFPQEERLAACLDERVPVISFFWRDPSFLVPRAHAGGAIVMHTVGSTAAGKQAVSCGVDIVIAQGWEAGGHVRGTVATMPLVPAVVDAVSPAPVVAAGGIADGRGLAAALALGAAGAWIGTRFLASHEAAIHPHYRERVLQANESDTAFLENLFDVRWANAPHRTLKNQTVAAWEMAGCPPSGKRPGEGEKSARPDRSGRSSAINLTRPALMSKVTSMPCPCGRDRVSVSCRSGSRRATSCERSPTKPERSFGGWPNDRFGSKRCCEAR
jgi:NAD(P)H-dependent flavin oxidoreductase YrpB (nitropropane dioxygenase family)